jgi:hypothetical protein
MAKNKISVVIDVLSNKATSSIKDFKKSVNEADGALGKMKAGSNSAFNSLKANSKMVSAAVAGMAAAFAVKAVGAASDLEESMNAVDVTFGEAAQSIHALGETSVESFGLSQAAFNSGAVSFAAFAKQVAGPGGEVADVMGDLMTRAVDFASVMNLDLNTAMTVFQSTLAGEAESMRRYGKDVSAAAVTQYALEAGLVASKTEMTEAIKVQARYGLLMRETDDVAGDFANTSGSLANQQKILSANLEDTSATIGRVLIPVATEGIKVLGALVDSLETYADLSTSIGHGLQHAFNRDALAARKASEAFIEVEESAGNYYDQATDGAKSVEEVRATALALGLELHAVNLITIEWAKSNDIATSSIDEMDDATVNADKSVQNLDRGVRELTAAQKENTQATRDARDARLNASDATWAARDSEDAFYEAVKAATEALEDSELTTYEQSAAVREAAQATDDMVRAQLLEEGVLIDTTRGAKLYTDQLADTALFLGGPMGEEILAHVGRISGIPDEKVTEIQAQIDEGNIATAKRLIEEQLSSADASIVVTPVGLEAARTRIESILGRTINIPTNTFVPSQSGGANFFARGTNSSPSGPAVINEQGAELVELPGGSKVATAAASKELMAGVAANVNAGISQADIAAISTAVERGLLRGFKGIRQNERAS